MADKKKVKRYTTIGKAIYPHLQKPNTRFIKEQTDKGDWEVQLAIPLDQGGQDLLDLCKRAEQAALNEAKKTSEKAEIKFHVYDMGDDGIPVFKFKAKAGGINKKGEEWTFTPPVFDTTGNVLNPVPAIGSGSTLAVSFSVNLNDYTALAGATIGLRIAAIQLIELVEWTPDAGSYGFETNGEGYAGDNDNFGSSGDEDGGSTGDDDDDFGGSSGNETEDDLPF